MKSNSTGAFTIIFLNNYVYVFQTNSQFDYELEMSVRLRAESTITSYRSRGNSLIV